MWSLVVLSLASCLVFSQACVCEDVDFGRAYCFSDAVFRAWVQGFRDDTEDFYFNTTFTISQIYKSDEYDYLPAEWESVVIGTPADPAYCDISFSLGVEYVVFATIQNNRLTTNGCSHSLPVLLMDEYYITHMEEGVSSGYCGEYTGVYSGDSA